MNRGQSGVADKPDEEIAADVARMLHNAGQSIPETESEVERFEKMTAGSNSTLPAALLDVDAAFAYVYGKRGKVLKLVPKLNADVEESLGRAAREGGALSTEVEIKMREDRKRAEQDASRKA